MVSISKVINSWSPLSPWRTKGENMVIPEPNGQGHLAEVNTMQDSLVEAETTDREDLMHAGMLLKVGGGGGSGLSLPLTLCISFLLLLSQITTNYVT